MKRCVFLVMFAVILLCQFSKADTAGAVDLRIDPTVTVLPTVNGQTFDVDVVLDNVTDLGAFEFDIGYPPSAVEIANASDVALGPCLGSTGRTPIPVAPVIDNTTGLLSYGAASIGTVGGGFTGSNCVLATVTFTVVGQDIGTLDLMGSQVTDTQLIPNVLPITSEADGTLACGGDEACDDGDICNGTETCNLSTNECMPGNPASEGTACGDPSETECDNPDTCDGAGACVSNLEPQGAACGDPTDTECDNPDTCDGAGACITNLEPPGAACGDQGVECVVDDACDGAGACVDNGLEQAGTACGDPADTECDNPDTCNGAGACITNLEPPGAACGDQGVECVVDDACDGEGSCVDNGLEQAGTACGDPTDTECDNPDTCDGGGACITNLEPVETPCGDDTDTLCDNPDTCDGAGACQLNFEAAGTSCDEDGLFCNGTDTCDASGQCQAGATPCDDGVGCTDDPCDETNDVCEAAIPNNNNCPDDGISCNGTEFCDAVNDCSSPNDVCGPNESCDEVADMCVVILTKPVPAMNQWGMIAFVVLAGVGSLIYLIRRKRA